MSPFDKLDDFSHIDLTAGVTEVSSTPVASGGYAEVFRCQCNGIDVALKVFHHIRFNPDVLARIINREVKHWSMFSHGNILPLRGVFYRDKFGWPSLVTPWMKNGTINEYLAGNFEADICGLVYELSDAVDFVHSNNIVHGDIRGANILVTDDGRAQLADFGLSRSVLEEQNVLTSYNVTGSLRWMAIEYFDIPDDIDNSSGEKNPSIHPRRTKPSDVWSFGMTVLEILTGNYPYFGIPHMAVMLAIANGKLPKFPESTRLESGPQETILRGICNECWVRKPELRPKMSDIAFSLRITKILPKSKRQSPTATSSRCDSTEGKGVPSVTPHPSTPPTEMHELGKVHKSTGGASLSSDNAVHIPSTNPNPRNDSSPPSVAGLPRSPDGSTSNSARPPRARRWTTPPPTPESLLQSSTEGASDHNANEPRFKDDLTVYRIKLNEYLQAKGVDTSTDVDFKSYSEGQSNAPMWTVICYLRGVEQGRSSDSKKKIAKEFACKNAFTKLCQTDPSPPDANSITYMYHFKRWLATNNLNDKCRWESDFGGECHSPTWTSKFYLDGEEFGHGIGHTKSDAEEEAAEATGRMLNAE
ncbi:kinase-like protein [Rickenella mellea]|uniref:Kinase-like protein n=1 Tax=Rickenella mellea TaxID=50990 RepID=A0A4Y7PZM5_9AGAM|nr:kinase-like protein [Rickenella mellea]